MEDNKSTNVKKMVKSVLRNFGIGKYNTFL